MRSRPDSGSESTSSTGAFPLAGMRPLALLLLVLLLGLGMIACGGGRVTSDVGAEVDTMLSDDEQLSSEDAPLDETVTDEALYADTTLYTESGQLLGEALGLLDARMRTAPADSLPELQMEYQRLLALARSKRLRSTDRIQTGATQNGTAHDEYDELDGASDEEAITIPSSGLKGLRQSELAPSRSSKRATARRESKPTESKTRETRPRESKPRQTATARARTNARPAETATASRARTATPAPAPATPQDAQRRAERQLVDGTAAVRAGKYSEGARELQGAVASSKLPGTRKSTATLDYALSLEKSGKLSDAAEQYLALSRSGGDAGHRAYVAYCRVLGQLGERGKARELVIGFLKKHPDSSQAVAARMLLQRL